MNKRIFLYSPVFFLMVMFLGISAHAMTVRPINLQELVSDSQYIVKVKVLSKDAAVDTQESGHIVNYYTFEVLEWLKGTPSGDGQLVIKQIGQGEYTVDGYRIRQNLYFPEYEIGKTYVLFLPEAHPRTGLLAPLGLQQGVFDVKIENGKEIIPQLKHRHNSLKARIPQNTKNKFLLFQLDTAKEEPTYQNFKSMIESAGAKP